MDFWGDAQQISAAIGGLATVGVAAFGWKLWRATDDLAKQTSDANALAERLSRQEMLIQRRPLFSVMIEQTSESAGFLYVRHLPESPAESVVMITPVLGEAYDRGDGRRGERPVRGPWRFAAGADNAEQRYGWTVDGRCDLARGSSTRWLLSRQINDSGRVGDMPWTGRGPTATGSHDGPCLVNLTARAELPGDEHVEWSYSAVVPEPGAEVRP